MHIKNKRWIELKPIGYFGVVLGLGGIIGPKLFLVLMIQ
jgi:hypothetical protein